MRRSSYWRTILLKQETIQLCWSNIKLRDAELLKSVLAGHVPELRTYTTTCP